MTTESRSFLEEHRHHYDLLIRAQYVKHLDGATREGLLQVARKEFDPGYVTDLWCPTCVVTLLTYVYTQYDKFLSAESNGTVAVPK